MVLLHLAPCRKVTMSRHRCASVGVGVSVSWCGHLFPCGDRMLSVDSLVFLGVFSLTVAVHAFVCVHTCLWGSFA